MNDKSLYIKIGMGILIVSFVLFLAIRVVPSVIITLTKAAPPAKVSISNSYLLGGRTLARADGEDQCVVNAFILDKDGKGVRGIYVSLDGGPDGVVETISADDGKAVFNFKSKVEKQYKLTGTIDVVSFGKEVTVTFRGE